MHGTYVCVLVEFNLQQLSGLFEYVYVKIDKANGKFCIAVLQLLQLKFFANDSFIRYLKY